MLDTHCHLTYDGLFERVDAVIAAAAAAGVDRMITLGTSPDDARKAVALAQQFDSVYAAVGLHPHHAAQWSDKTLVVETLRQLAANPRVVALGEMGLDRHYPDPPLEMQRRSLEWQLELAADLDRAPDFRAGAATQGRGRGRGLPIIIHNREATDDILPILRGSGLPGDRFDFHCFTGSAAELDAILDFGAMVGFTGIVTFKNARTLADLAAHVPADRLLLETDSPYLTPEPHRKVKINEPQYVRAVARFLAEKRGVREADLVAQCDANAQWFFYLPKGMAAAFHLLADLPDDFFGRPRKDEPPPTCRPMEPRS